MSDELTPQKIRDFIADKLPQEGQYGQKNAGGIKSRKVGDDAIAIFERGGKKFEVKVREIEEG
jgi:hypothetical protein